MANYTVVVENETTQWQDALGEVYHYPKRYQDLLSPGTLLLHYKSQPKTGDDLSKRFMRSPHYFATSVAGESHADPASNKGDRFVGITGFRMFSKGVVAKKTDGFYESIPPNRATNFWRDGVRRTSADVFQSVLVAAGMALSLGDTVNENTDPFTSTLVEGGKKQVYTTVYERRPELRRQAVEFHGTTCLACDVNLGAIYGQYAEGHIHIHHKRPLSVTGETIVDPKTDLVPLCPTCHAIVHLRGKLLSVNAVRAMLQKPPVGLGD